MNFCNECTNKVDICYYIGDSYYCIDCINKYMLIKCPSVDCNNIISLNGYNFNDTNDNICSSCEAQYCSECIIKNNNIILCKDCIYI
jgi:hypothetical protein